LLAPRLRAGGADAAGVRNEPRDRIRPAPLGAEQVEKVDPNLIARDADGKPYTVRYDAVNAMLLNAFLKEHRQVTQLKTTVAPTATTDREVERRAYHTSSPDRAGER
jgi:hypothetical protein